ncbi:MAG: hypothetical protein IPN33_02205 [Saprospiraceae bacterium]|nr:hypothetical protein [Saprospiraceae bacterium]
MHKILHTAILALLAGASLWGQGIQTQYGKNRVQFHRDFDEWSQYESDNFIAYWYGEGRNIGQAVVQLAEQDFASVQQLLEHRINEKIQIIVYTDLTDLKQSNIGSEEAFTNTGGQTKIVGNKVFVYFDGNHRHLRRQIREGIAEVFLDAMLFGSNIQEIVQNAVALNLPEWFKQGLAAYVGEPWSSDLDNRLRDALLRADFENFETFAEENPRLAGHSLWYFIGENFGASTVSNLLYLTRINRSVESGFLYVLGSPYEVITNGWYSYFHDRYASENALRQNPVNQDLQVKNKRKLPVSEVKISPDGQKVIYSTNEIGRFKVYMQDTRTGKRELIFAEGFRNAFQATDYNYPLLAWNPNNNEIAIIYERRDVVKLLTYDLSTKKSKTTDFAPDYQRVHSMSYVNPMTLVLSGTSRGFSDIFLYYLNTRQSERLTNDFYDDLDAAYVQLGGRRGILFASNRDNPVLQTARLDSIMPVGTFDIYYFDLDTRDKELIPITQTPLANERQPIPVDTALFAYLSDRSGLYNRETAYLEDYIHHYEQIVTLKDGSEFIFHADSALVGVDSQAIDTIRLHPVLKKRAVQYSSTNSSRSIEAHSTSPRTGKLAELIFIENEYRIFYGNVGIDTLVMPMPTLFQENQRKKSKEKTVEEVPAPPANNQLIEVPTPEIREEDIPVEKLDTGKIDIDNYLFQSEFDDEDVPPTVIQREENKVEKEESPSPVTKVQQPQVTTLPPPAISGALTSTKGVYRFRPGMIIPYRLQFRTDFVTTQLDNSLLFDGLETISANPNGFGYPPPGILLKANFKDLFEDYEFEGGVRVPTSFNGTEYFLTFNNKKQRLDKRFSIYRRNLRETDEVISFVPRRREMNTMLGQYGVRYPLDIFRSLRATATLRRDRVEQLATERPALDVPTVNEQRAGIKLEYVFDNTLDVALNIKNGSRYKIFFEAVKRFDVNTNEGFNVSFNEGFMSVFGLDARHYQRIDKHSILALRVAGATSFGSEKMLYYLGGVDNWLFPAFSNDIPVPEGGDFAFQTLATPVRGFRMNIRNGNSFAVFNAELRAPIFKYFSKRIKSPFLRNFQVVGFFDMGTAWQGKDPFSIDNPLNTSYYPQDAPNPPVVVKVNYFRDPIVAGYGFGVRTVLFGYFVRVDYAWGIETRKVLAPRLYIALGMDF